MASQHHGAHLHNQRLALYAALFSDDRHCRPRSALAPAPRLAPFQNKRGDGNGLIVLNGLWQRLTMPKTAPPGPKPVLILKPFTARLKSCPFKTTPSPRAAKGFPVNAPGQSGCAKKQTRFSSSEWAYLPPKAQKRKHLELSRKIDGTGWSEMPIVPNARTTLVSTGHFQTGFSSGIGSR